MIPLLPIGLHDMIGAEAYWLNHLKQTCLRQLYHYGYDLVEPTPLEYEDNRLPASRESRFRVHDPNSDAPLILRSDITPQIARIARQHYNHQEPPIRLGYVGQVFRMRASQMKPERQSTQVGAELYAPPSEKGLLEIIRLMLWLLRALEVGPCVLDLSDANITHRVLDLAALTPEQRAAVAVKQKPEGLSPSALALIEPLLTLTGPKADQLAGVYPADIDQDVRRLLVLRDRIADLSPDVRVSLDWSDMRFLSYHQGVCFHLFALNQDIGRGGMYTSQGLQGVGFSFYLDAIVRHAVLSRPLPPIKVLSSQASDHDMMQAISQGHRLFFRDS